MKETRLRIKHKQTFEQRLENAAQQYREAAKDVDGYQRQALLNPARQAEAAHRLTQWLSSPVLPRRYKDSQT